MSIPRLNKTCRGVRAEKIFAPPPANRNHTAPEFGRDSLMRRMLDCLKVDAWAAEAEIFYAALDGIIRHFGQSFD